MAKRLLGFFLLGISQLAPSFGQSADTGTIPGDWSGTIAVSGHELPLIIHIIPTGRGLDATLDSPAQGMLGTLAESVSFNSNAVTITFPSLGARYTGTLIDGQLIGHFHQLDSSFPLNLVRIDKARRTSNGHQLGTEATSYVSEEIHFHNPESDIKLAGTMTLPRQSKPRAIVILLSGSGPQNRDELIGDHKPFFVIADYLTRHNYAVLRFDDRGAGMSEGDFAKATLNDFSTDALAAVSYAKSHQELKNLPLGFIGHSEGALVACLAANKSSDVDFIVMLAGPGVPGKQLYLEQVEAIYRKSGYPEEKLSGKLRYLTLIMDRIQNTDVHVSIEATILPYVTALADIDAQGKEQTKALVDSYIRTFSLPSFRDTIKSEPQKILSNVKVPVLALSGEKDLQVIPETNLSGIERAINDSGGKVQTKLIPDLNHLFQHSHTGLPSEYLTNEETFAKDALSVMEQWISQVVSAELADTARTPSR